VPWHDHAGDNSFQSGGIRTRTSDNCPHVQHKVSEVGIPRDRMERALGDDAYQPCTYNLQDEHHRGDGELGVPSAEAHRGVTGVFIQPDGCECKPCQKWCNYGDSASAGYHKPHSPARRFTVQMAVQMAEHTGDMGCTALPSYVLSSAFWCCRLGRPRDACCLSAVSDFRSA
jgi:hypothetical protein